MPLDLALRILSLCVALAGVETLHGIARTVLVVPRIGKARALKLSIVTGSALAWGACRLLVPDMGLHTAPDLLALGLLLAAFMAAFDIATKTLLPWAPAVSLGSASVNAIAVSGDRVYVGGAFFGVTPVGGSLASRSNVAAFAADDTGTLLPWAPEVGNFNVWSLAATDDTVYVGGDFTGVRPAVGTPLTRNRIAAFAADGTGTVLPWAPSFNGTVHSLSLAQNATFAGGSSALIVGGGFTDITPVGGSPTTRNRIAAVALDDTGTLLPWAPSVDGTVMATSVSRGVHRCPPDVTTTTCVYLGGSFTQASSVGPANQPRARIAAVSLDDTGTLLPWSPGVSDTAVDGLCGFRARQHHGQGLRRRQVRPDRFDCTHASSGTRCPGSTHLMGAAGGRWSFRRGGRSRDCPGDRREPGVRGRDLY